MHKRYGNATFLLNIPPTPEGIFYKTDVERLNEIGKYLESSFGNPFFLENFPKIIKSRNNFIIEAGFDKNFVKNIILQEDISKSQRIETFFIELKSDEKWQKIFSGTVIGYKKIIKLKNPIFGNAIRITITDSRCEPILEKMEIY